MKGASYSRPKALAYLKKMQAADGSFLGQASQHTHNFSQSRVHYTSFFTSLIVCSLAEIKGASSITQKAATFLLTQKSADWSWNYWITGSPDDQKRPYPDDLDDTACALSALYLTVPRTVDGAVLGNFARQLISQETAVGGPYTTWLVQPAAEETWRDVDCAVNANIGYFLSLHNVTVPGLTSYIESLLSSDKLQSRYYIGALPTLYFIARWYKGPAQAKLRQLIAQQLHNEQYASDPLALALLLAAGCRADISKVKLAGVYHLLLGLYQQDHWAASALYNEPPVDGKNYYAGSTALTTALALEALDLFETLSTTEVETPPALKPIIVPDLPAGSDLRSNYASLIRGVITADVHNEVTRIGTVIAQACGARLAPAQLSHFNRASVNGWAAYSIYDDIIDGQVDPALVGAANAAQRRMLHHFNAALPDNPQYAQLVARTMDGIDAANTWEAVRARAKVADGIVSLARLPHYGSYRQLARRSWGHILAPIGVLVSLGYAASGNEVTQLCRFFRHYIIARQLNDDAHDWEDDLRAGIITAVIVQLLDDAGLSPPVQMTLSRDLDSLKACFWNYTILSVTADIAHHCSAARKALAACAFIVEPKVLEGWISNLEQSADAALHERQEAKAFMQHYAGETNKKASVRSTAS
ncbi:MAG: hypothetical protein JWM81_1118 [Candidatus Saccharibacteria bacterium]|nr:hypothetical protein [Candidatus Saccharibacteria bacterium]